MNIPDEIKYVVAERLGVADDAFTRLSVCVFPQMLVSSPPYALSRIFRALSIEPQSYSPWNRYDLCVCFEDHTTQVVDVVDYFMRSSKLWIHNESTEEWRLERQQVRRFVNAECRDISKERVGRVFADVFGYPLDVDPRSYEGSIVRKSNSNASHDGRVITGPISEEEYRGDRGEVVYSVHVDNIHGDMINDLRLMWSGHLSPMLYRKERPVASRFKRGAKAAFLEPVSNHISLEETGNVEKFCRAFGLDYGELDCLRDRQTGRLYIVDANKTPCAHFAGMSKEEGFEGACLLATEFAREFLLDL